MLFCKHNSASDRPSPIEEKPYFATRPYPRPGVYLRRTDEKELHCEHQEDDEMRIKSMHVIARNARQHPGIGRMDRQPSPQKHIERKVRGR